jgi:hypothetical protein
VTSSLGKTENGGNTTSNRIPRDEIRAKTRQQLEKLLETDESEDEVPYLEQEISSEKIVQQAKLPEKQETAPDKRKIPNVELTNNELLDAFTARMAQQLNVMEAKWEQKVEVMVDEKFRKEKEQIKKDSDLVKKRVVDTLTAVEEGINNFVVEQVGQCQSDMAKINHKFERLEMDKSAINTEIESFRSSMKYFNKSHEEREKERKDREKKEEEERKNTPDRIDSGELKELSDKFTGQDRKWRKYNIRINKLNDYVQGETTKETVTRFIYRYRLLNHPHTLQEIHDKIDHAYRFGSPVGREKIRQILVRFIDLDTKEQVARIGKRKDKANEMSPTFIQEDHSLADQERKEVARDFMKEAYTLGLLPRFYEGVVKIKPKNGRRRVVSEEEIKLFNENPENGIELLKKEAGKGTSQKKTFGRQNANQEHQPNDKHMAGSSQQNDTETVPTNTRDDEAVKIDNSWEQPIVTRKGPQENPWGTEKIGMQQRKGKKQKINVPQLQNTSNNIQKPDQGQDHVEPQNTQDNTQQPDQGHDHANTLSNMMRDSLGKQTNHGDQEPEHKEESNSEEEEDNNDWPLPNEYRDIPKKDFEKLLRKMREEHSKTAQI